MFQEGSMCFGHAVFGNVWNVSHTHMMLAQGAAKWLEWVHNLAARRADSRRKEHNIFVIIQYVECRQCGI